MAFLPLFHRALAPESLSQAEAEAAMTAILSGEATTAQIAAFLVALKLKGETVDEIAGFAQAMRRHAIPVVAGALGMPLVDTAGTGGGEGPQTFNISTVAAFVIAGAGVAVAKHGNRSLSSLCGSADVMEELGVNLALNAEQMAECLRQTGIAFLFAPALQPAMRHAQPARLELKTRTAFNLLGPLTNPAGARIQLIGAPSRHAAKLLASALARLEVDRALVVHGADGLDEISLSAETYAFEVTPGEVVARTLMPEDFGLALIDAAELAGAGRVANAAIAEAILRGEPGARRDVVVANAAAALWLAGRAGNLAEAARMAEESIDSGAARAKLRALVEASRGLG